MARIWGDERSPCGRGTYADCRVVSIQLHFLIYVLRTLDAFAYPMLWRYEGWGDLSPTLVVCWRCGWVGQGGRWDMNLRDVCVCVCVYVCVYVCVRVVVICVRVSE
jgi:hypothetical protein